MPTILEWIGVDAPVQCDGASLLDVLHGEDPTDWRDAVHWEWDFRDPTGRLTQEMFGIGIDECSLAVLRDERGQVRALRRAWRRSSTTSSATRTSS